MQNIAERNIMAIRQNIFGSSSEQQLFSKLRGNWDNAFDLWPNLPLQNIIEIKEELLTQHEWQTYLKMTVDYTLCDKNGKPLLSIEFDGLGNGFSKDGQYIETQKSNIDPYRKLKLDFKLRIANENRYPFVIVSYPEACEIGCDTHLTIVHGIIGQILARGKSRQLLRTYFENNKQEIDRIPAESADDYFQDIVTNAEVVAELELDPIVKLASILSCEAWNRGLVQSFSYHYLHDPMVPDFDLRTDGLEKLEERINKINEAKRIGCCFQVKTPRGEISMTTWVRNFQGLYIEPGTIARNIAELITFDKVFRNL